MNPDPKYQSLPSTSLDTTPGTCPRCGQVSEPTAETCSRCGTALPELQAEAPEAQPRVATAYVEQTLRCTPEELEAIARREAVDGWTLVDTTVDSDQPDMLQAHFRRRADADDGGRERSARGSRETRRSKEPAAKPVAGQKPAATRVATATKRPSGPPTSPQSKQPAPRRIKEKRVSERDLGRPSSWDQRVGKAAENRIFYTVMALSMAMAISFIGWPGIFLAMFAVPGMARKIAKMSRAELAILGFAAAVLYSGMGAIGFFAALFALPGIVRTMVKD